MISIKLENQVVIINLLGISQILWRQKKILFLQIISINNVYIKIKFISATYCLLEIFLAEVIAWVVIDNEVTFPDQMWNAC